MFKTIKILILKQDSSNPGQMKELYRNSISVAFDISFDYGLVESAFRLLYPDCFVQFTIG